MGLVRLYRALSKSGGKSEDGGGRSPMPLQLGFWDCSEERLGCACARQERGGALRRPPSSSWLWVQQRCGCAVPQAGLMSTADIAGSAGLGNSTLHTVARSSTLSIPLWVSIMTWMILARAPARRWVSSRRLRLLGAELEPRALVKKNLAGSQQG